MVAWPPPLDKLKKDMKIDPAPSPELDERLQMVLDASIAFVERVRRADFNFEGDLGSELPDPTSDIELGTLRLAARWDMRRRSPDALIQMAELGASRVPSFDPDIDRLLGLGRYRGPVFA